MKLVLFAMWAPGFVLAGVTEGSAAPTDLLAQIGLGAVIASPFIYLWRDERKQRIAGDDRNREQQAALTSREREMSDTVVPLLARAVDTLDAMHRGVDQTVERANAAVPSRSDWDFVLRRLELLTDQGRRREQDDA